MIQVKCEEKIHVLEFNNLEEYQRFLSMLNTAHKRAGFTTLPLMQVLEHTGEHNEKP